MQNAANAALNQTIRNPVDPTRVVRADGRDGEQTGNAAQNDFTIINYESNYSAFVKSLSENGDLAGALERLLLTDGGLYADGDQEIGALVDRFLMTMKMDSAEEILEFLKGQQGLQARFGGGLFQELRSILSNDPSNSLKDAILSFLKGYNNYSSGTHLLRQMNALVGDIEQLLLRQYREEFREIADSMNWRAANGDTAGNVGLLTGRMIPFLARYISNTHDYGPVRDATMLLVLFAARYQEGEEGRLAKLFERMLDNRDFGRLFKGDAQAGMEQLLREGAQQRRSVMTDFADSLANLLRMGANGHGGLENVQQFYTILNGMLLNESVYMPLLHFLVPFQFEENNVVSEMWVDPDARREGGEGGRAIKLFLKFDIQSLGKFELMMFLQDRESKVQLFVPTGLAKQNKKIQADVSDILKRNGIRLNQFSVYERIRDRRIDEVFPEIREKEKTINVRI